ncbi:MAG: protein-arginine deiminase family protein [Tepidisphaeraceae bacterium]
MGLGKFVGLEGLESRCLMAAQPGIKADLLADTDRNGVINAADDDREDGWNFIGTGGRGGIILPNLDRDNTTTNAPDNWTGGVFNGRPVPPNNVIDNTADLADIGRVRLNKLNADAPWEYRLTVRLLKPKFDPAWYQSSAATDRVRLFFPTKSAGNDTVPQAGDVAVIGPGLGDTIVFCNTPGAANEYSIMDLAGPGGFFFGVEGIKSGANVRLEAKLEYVGIDGSGQPMPAEPVNTDAVELKVAPFVMNDHRQRVKTAIVDDLTPFGIDNSAVQKTIKNVFGSKAVISNSGDPWQQDGYEIGYVAAPYGAMPVVLELPRARNGFFSTTNSMRTFVRGSLLKAGVGVSLDVASLPADSSSRMGGDIETIYKPGSKTPGYLLVSNMPADLKNYFAAQGVNKAINLPLDWLSVNHVDEVVQMTPGGKAIVADTDLAWALLLWANKIDPNVRLHAGMNGNEYGEDYTAEGIRASRLLANTVLRNQNLEYAQRVTSLRGVVSTIKGTLGLSEEVSTPAKTAGAGTAKLARAGVFTQLLAKVVREFSIKFTSSTDYQLRYRDGSGGWSSWSPGKTTRDEVFGGARAFILKNYWSGTAKAGDAFSFKTNPNATLLKMPVLFSGSAGYDGVVRMTPFSEDHVNSLVDGNTVITGKAFGPRVTWNGGTKSDLFQDYVGRAFAGGGYTNVVFTDSRVYHDAAGSIHCATNVIRETPTDKWWAV